MGLAVFLGVVPMAQVSTRLLLSRRCISLWSAHPVQPAIKTSSRDGMRHVGSEARLGCDSLFEAGLRTPPTSSHPMVG